MNTELQIASLALLAELLTEEQFINSINDIKGLLKLEELLFNENNGIVSNAILCIYSVIPNFNYHKTMFKDKILKRLSFIAGNNYQQTTKILALVLLKKLIDNANEMEIEALNENCCGNLVNNLFINKNDNLLE